MQLSHYNLQDVQYYHTWTVPDLMRPGLSAGWMFPQTFCSFTTALTDVSGQKFSAVPNLNFRITMTIRFQCHFYRVTHLDGYNLPLT